LFILGSKNILNEKAYICKNIDEILKYHKSNLIIIKDIELAKFCFKNKIKYIAWINDIALMIYFFNLKANYFIHENIEFTSKLQKIANEYLMDSKIGLIANNDNCIKKAIEYGIDGVIFKSCFIVKTK
jgi:hypothetical protein